MDFRIASVEGLSEADDDPADALPEIPAGPPLSRLGDLFGDFQLLHPMLSTLEIEDMVPSEAVMPIHPGALKYYREAGLLT